MSDNKPLTAQQPPPKIEFPCPDYPIKIMGVSGEQLHNHVVNTIKRYAPDFDAKKITINHSRQGTFQSITVLITATGEQQLRDLNDALRTSELVKIVI